MVQKNGVLPKRLFLFLLLFGLLLRGGESGSFGQAAQEVLAMDVSVGQFSPEDCRVEDCRVEDCSSPFLSPGPGAYSDLSAQIPEGLRLIPGGMLFGVRFATEGVTVVGYSDPSGDGRKGVSPDNPARRAGLKPKDVILSVDGAALSGAAHLTELIEGSGGKSLLLSVRRGKEILSISLSPVRSPVDGKYKTGIWVRDTGAGIGTVSFILPDSSVFGGLGHGICDESGAPIPMRSTALYDVTLTSVSRGAPGSPGELKGYFGSEKQGSLLGNTVCGVFGQFTSSPEELFPSLSSAEALPVASRDEIVEGPASVLCSVSGSSVASYSVEISSIRPDSLSSKCFSVKVTDPSLLSLSGGIVQGMSGSPLIQNGKIIGAITHVLVNDPSSGYGIFIENMLSSLPLPALVSEG